MKQLLLVIAIFYSTLGNAQALRDINYNYLYSPSENFFFNIMPVRTDGGWQISYNLRFRDTTSNNLSGYIVRWETRRNLNEKESQSISKTDSAEWRKGKGMLYGKFTMPLKTEPEVIVAKVINTSLARAWLYYAILEPNYPVTYSVSGSSSGLGRGFVHTGDSLRFNNKEIAVVSFYDDNFPVALPAFSESQGKVSKGMEVDSTFVIAPNETVRLRRKGLYLIQRDTSAAEGLAIRAENDYPRFTRISSLAGPMVYISTKQEYDRLSGPKVSKKEFDKVILGVTNDTDRAKKLIRNYFRRVELANQFFTSYKEGWKTDRGMIYIVFGAPDEVYKFQDREVWYYQADLFRANFTFLKSPSLFDPENYVLIRDRKFQQTWYEVVDLWRNARF